MLSLVVVFVILIMHAPGATLAVVGLLLMYSSLSRSVWPEMWTTTVVAPPHVCECRAAVAAAVATPAPPAPPAQCAARVEAAQYRGAIDDSLGDEYGFDEQSGAFADCVEPADGDVCYDVEANGDLLDGDELTAYQSCARNVPDRVVAGTMNRRRDLDWAVREEVDEAEDRVWWGRHEV